MAIGQFVDYAELGNGGYKFLRADGSPFAAMGPEAAAMAAAIDRQKHYAPDLRLASNEARGHEDQGGAQSVSDVSAESPGFSANPDAGVRQGQDVSTPVDASRYVPQGAGPIRPVLAAEQGVPGALAPVPQGPQAQPLYGTKGGGVVSRDPSGALIVRTPGTASTTQAQLQKKAGQGVALPTGQATTVEGGFEPSSDYLEQKANAAIDQKFALNKLNDAESERAAAAQRFNDQRVADQAKSINTEQQRQAQIQAGVNTDLAQLQQAQAEQKAAKVDPDRMFRGAGGAARQIGMAIASGMGAFGASMNHTQNFAQQVIDAAINRDVSEQEHELARRGATYQNALGQWIRSTGSLEMARSAVKIQQLEFAKAQADQIAGMNKTQEVQANHQLTVAGIDAKLADEFEAYRQASLGKHTQQVSAQIAYPQAGRAGTTRLATAEEVGADLGVQEKGATVAKTRAEAAKLQGEAAGGGKGGVPRGLQNRYLSAGVALQKIDKIAQTMGVPQGRNGELDPSKYGYGDYYSRKVKAGGTGEIATGSDDFTRTLDAAATALIPDIANANGNTSEGHMRDLHEEWDSASPGAKAHLLQSWRESLQVIRDEAPKVSGPQSENPAAPTNEAAQYEQ